MKYYFDFAKIRVFKWQNKLTTKQFCELCNISQSVYNRMQKNDFSFSVDALFRVAEVLNIKPLYLIEKEN